MSDCGSTGDMEPQQLTQKILVIDDHETILMGLLPKLEVKFPDVQIYQAQSRADAERILEKKGEFILVIVDLSLPEQVGNPARSDVGFNFVDTLLHHPKAPNILVLSTNLKPLVRLKSKINAYEGGFATVDKSQPVHEIIQMADLAIHGAVCWSKLLRQVGFSRELDRQWLEVAKLKFQEGLNDKAIAHQMDVSDRTVRNYWIRLQDALQIPDDPTHDVRVQIMLRLKELGFLN